MLIINSCEHIENNCAIFAMCGFPVTSGAGARPVRCNRKSAAFERRHDAARLRMVRRIQHDSIDLHNACSACVERGEYAFSPMARRGWALAFLDGVRPISTLHGVVFAILGPAQRSTPSGTRRRQCFAPRRSDTTSSHHALGAGKSNHDLPEMAALLHKFQRFRHSIEGDGSVDDRL